RDKYRQHVTKMFALLGEPMSSAEQHAARVLEIETALAQTSRTRVELRDPNKNYNKFALHSFAATNPASAWPRYFDTAGLGSLHEVIVGQPEFFTRLDQMLQERPLSQWKIYLRWHLLRTTAPYLHYEAEQENFDFYGTQLRGQPEPEPR